MKKIWTVLLIAFLAVGLILSGCGNGKQEQEQQQEQQQEQEQQSSSQLSTLTGEFQGLADSHSVEIVVDGEPQVYQFFAEDVAAAFENMETGTALQFDVEADAENGTQTIVKLYETPAEG